MSDETERLIERMRNSPDARHVNAAINHMRALQAKVDRLTSRGFHDLHFENDELKARVKELEKAARGLNNAVDEFWNDHGYAATEARHLIRANTTHEVHICSRQGLLREALND